MSFDKKTFEFSLYNSEVRELVLSGESHKQLDDGWSEQRYIQVRAIDEATANTEARRRYPERKGFVYTSVTRFID